MEPDKETPERSGHGGGGGHKTAWTRSIWTFKLRRLLISLQMSRYRSLTCLAVSFGGGGSRIKCSPASVLRSQDQKGGDQPVKHSARFEHAHLISRVCLTICGTFWDQPPRVCSEFLPLQQPPLSPKVVQAGMLEHTEFFWRLLACRLGGACLRASNLWVNPVLV